MYIPIQTLDHCFALGIFDNIEDAKNAYIEYIHAHKNFDMWFERLKKDFNNLFQNLSINTLDDFKKVIFCEYQQGTISDNQAEIMHEFWEDRSIADDGDIIREVSDNYPRRDLDAMDLAAHLEFSYDDTFGNHASNLFFSIVYRSENRFTQNFDNYIPRMAELHPIF